MAAGGAELSLTQMGEEQLRRNTEDLENAANNNRQRGQEEQNTQETLRQQAREDAKREIDERIAARDTIVKSFMPNAQEGLLSKIEYQTQLTPEGMAGAILAEFFVLAVRLLFNTDYMRQTADYNKLKAANMVHLIYEPDENGNYPNVYRVNPITGEIDYDQKIPDGEAKPFEIRMNGLVPIPNWTEGLLHACDLYMADMVGQGGLTLEQKNRAFGVLEAADKEMRGGNHKLARDRAAMEALRPRPMPRPIK